MGYKISFLGIYIYIYIYIYLLGRKGQNIYIFLLTRCPSQFMCILTNFMDAEVNNYINSSDFKIYKI